MTSKEEHTYEADGAVCGGDARPVICRACGRSWSGQHRCGETIEEAEANARAAILQAENGRLHDVIVDAYRRCEAIEGLFSGKAG